jgi:hypothetical protein
MQRRIRDGNPPRRPSHNENVQIAAPLEADLLEPGPGAEERVAPLQLTPDVRYSLVLEVRAIDACHRTRLLPA